MEKMVRVVATKEGFDNTCLRQEGDEFDMPESAVIQGATWFKPVADPKAKKDAKQRDAADLT